MNNIEWFNQFFRGGSRGGDLSGLRKKELVSLLADIFHIRLYKKISITHYSRSVDCRYTDNQAFWLDAMSHKHFQSMCVQLEGFHLLEWIPSAPGRYFTSSAQSARRDAQEDFNIRLNEYSPMGKGNMVLGGIGSVRLGAKRIGTDNVYFLSASSNGISHQGIPIALLESEYHQVMKDISKYYGCFVNLTGTLQILPISKESFQYDKLIPRYCLLADKIEVLRPSSDSELLITIAIIFQHSLSSTAFGKSWSFASFSPGSADDNLETAVEWLKSYAERYSQLSNPPILSDFDEHYRHFANPVEFPMTQVFDDKADMERLKEYASCYDFSIRSGEIHFSAETNSLITTDTHVLAKLPSYKAVNIFFSYAHEDILLLEELKKHLRLLQRLGYINLWYDQDVNAGMEREREINKFLDAADIILLLVSPDFMNTDYCYSGEMKYALELQEKGEALVIPIILRPVYWLEAPFSHLQCLPRNAKPVTDISWYNLDSALFDVAEGIRRVAEQLVKMPLAQSKTNTLEVSLSNNAKEVTSEDFFWKHTIETTHTLIHSISVSSDGKIFASAGTDGSYNLNRSGVVKLWSADTGQLLNSIDVPKCVIYALSISPDGQLLIGSGSDKTIKFWNLHTGQLLRTLKGLSDSVLSLAISKSGQILVSRSGDKSISLWNLDTGEKYYSLKLDSLSCFALHPNEEILACGGFFNGTIRLWSLHKDELLLTLVGHNERVESLVISPDGQMLVSGSGDNKVKLWSLYTGQLLLTLTGFSKSIDPLAISPDGKMLAICEHEWLPSPGVCKVKVYSLPNVQLLRTYTIEPAFKNLVSFSRDGDLFYSEGPHDFPKIKIWGKRRKLL